MAINKNHEFEELDGIKCAIAEKNCGPSRVEFLKDLLEWNNYTVVVASSPPPKVAPDPSVEVPPTFTVGVTDLMFNPINAIYGRLLKNRGGQVVSPAYWKQESMVMDEEKPYFAERPKDL